MVDKEEIQFAGKGSLSRVNLGGNERGMATYFRENGAFVCRL